MLSGILLKRLLAFTIALELSLDEAKDLLASAGFALSRSSKTDLIIAYFLQNRIYDMFKINDHDGLTPFGLQYIKEMERLGIIIDVSHLSDAGFYDVYHHTTKPFVASHSNTRQVCGVARNMSDDMILKLASRGGVMGINFCSDFLTTEGTHQTSYVKDMVQHILYIKNLAGIDCIGLGSDFDGIGSKLEMKDASGYQMLYGALIEAGLSIEEIEKIFYKNVLRVYKAVLK